MATPTPATGASTPQVELDPEETAKSLKVSLADLAAKAAALYAHKQYEEAAEVYAQAAEMQAEMNGEMSPENAEILFLYGRALFKVGQSKSDVLGGKAPESKKLAKPKPAKAAKSANGSGPATAEKKNETTEVAGSSAAAIAEAEKKLDEAVAEAAAKEAEKKEEEAPKPEQKKPLFQFEGDENFVDSEEEDEAEEGEGDEEEEEDDLAVAFEVLDLARVLFNKRLEAAQAEDEEQQGKGKEVAEDGDSAIVKHIKERLADTHDLLAEISLENERYHNAITDSRASLKYKEQLYPFESEVIAEAHFKLSLALEFASVTKSSEDDDKEASGGGDDKIDQALRDEAAAELEAAINSTKQKLQNKEVELATLHDPDDNEATRRQIADVKEVLADMEQRLVDLRKPPVDINAALGIPAAAQQQQIPEVLPEEVKKNATDLTGLVRKKRKAEEKPAEGQEIEAKKPRGEGNAKMT
ncbi:hypothetical protein C8A03DRAFT_12712 [Achaetomium macrosporum]|uniref:Tetratricopeptide SHNi-TPR domain-containing protein n=1 Tax=Achaetomium macrosporum TaxID=79813 RepID=A0AAN7CGU1_9PEZI|nr:hypothetical protein C8A03DRAFT_12712 [Achaetomium macrosporum]